MEDLLGWRFQVCEFLGCNFPNCPRTSIYEASERDFRVVVVEDAISGIYERGKEELRNIGVTVGRGGTSSFGSDRLLAHFYPLDITYALSYTHARP